MVFAAAWFIIRVYLAIWLIGMGFALAASIIGAIGEAVGSVIGFPGVVAGKLAGEKWKQAWHNLLGYCYLIALSLSVPAAILAWNLHKDGLL